MIMRFPSFRADLIGVIFVVYLSLVSCVLLVGSSKERTLIKINVNAPQPAARSNADVRKAFAGVANNPAPTMLTNPQRLVVPRAPATLTPPPSLYNFAYENETLSLAEVNAAVAEHSNEADDDPTRIPALWERLAGECYTSIIDQYEYAFCPFDNVTQRETIGTLFVLLGVYSSWNVTEQGEYVMSFTDGTSCGDQSRSINVAIKCANSSREFALRVAEVLDDELHDDQEQYAYDMDEIIEASYYAAPYIHDVREPRMCEYELHYHTPLVCPLYRYVRRQLRRTRDIEYRIDAKTHEVTQYDRATKQLHHELLACLQAMEADNSTNTATYYHLCQPFLEDINSTSTEVESASIDVADSNSPAESPVSVNEDASDHQTQEIRHAGVVEANDNSRSSDDHHRDQADNLHSVDQVAVEDDNRVLEARRSASTDRLTKRVEQRRERHNGRLNYL